MSFLAYTYLLCSIILQNASPYNIIFLVGTRRVSWLHWLQHDSWLAWGTKFLSNCSRRRFSTQNLLHVSRRVWKGSISRTTLARRFLLQFSFKYVHFFILVILILIFFLPLYRINLIQKWLIFIVSKGQVHEGILHNSDKGSVITWDFDVMRHDVVFTVYRLKIPLSLHSLAPLASCSSTLTAEKSQHHHQSTKSSSNSSTANSKTSPQPSPKEPNGATTKFTFPGKNGAKGNFLMKSIKLCCYFILIF